MPLKLSLVLPAVPDTEILSLLQILSEFFTDFEIILPHTEDPKISGLVQSNADTIRIVAGSLGERIGASRGDFLIFQRGAGIEELRKLAHYAGKADIVTGFSPQRQNTRFLSSILYRSSLREVGGFMLCKTSLLQKLNITFADKPLLLALEILGKAEREGYRIIEIELTNRPSPPESLTPAEISGMQRTLRRYKPMQPPKAFTIVPPINLYMVSGVVLVGLIWVVIKLIRGKNKQSVKVLV